MAWSNKVSIILMAVGLVMAAFGLWHGEAYLVLAKAIRVCLECIGIG